jgi:hypothetical protein
MLGRTTIAALAAVTASLVAAGTRVAAAGEYCVTCAGPEAHYACTFEGASAGPGDTGLKLYCITELAKSGKHQSCSVDRNEAKPCTGDVKVLAMPDGMAITPPAAATATDVPKSAAAPTGTVPAAENAAKAQPETPPKTVQEMVEKGTGDAGKTLQKGGDAVVETAKTTGGVIDKAGKAVGDTAKKTWTCITSFFGDC